MPLALEELPKHVLLSHRAVPQDWPDWDDWLAEVGSDMRVGARTRTFDSYPLMLQAAVNGQGIALGWRRTVHRMLEAGDLVQPCRETAWRVGDLSIFVGPEARAHRPARDALLAWLKDELRTEAWQGLPGQGAAGRAGSGDSAD